MRALPVAFVVNEGRATLYELVVRRAASPGLLRRAFRDEAEARDWLARAVQGLDDNHAWWAARR